MASLVTLAALRTRAQQAADMENAKIVSTAEWNSYINYGAQRLYDILVSKFGEEYAVKSAVLNIVSGTDTYDLPTDFYRARGVDVQVGSRALSCKRFIFRDRNKYNWAAVNWGGINGTPLYMLQGSKIRFMPVPNVTGGVVTLWYIPTLQVLVHGAGDWASVPLTNDDDALDDVNGYSEFIVLEAAIHAKLKEDTDAQQLMARRQEVLDWIEVSAAQRDAGEPMFIGQIQNNCDPFFESY